MKSWSNSAAVMIWALFAICGSPSSAQTTSPQTQQVPQDAGFPSALPANPSAITVPSGGPSAGPEISRDSKLRLGVGDLIEVNVYGVPELTTKTRVNGGGDAYLPLIDYIHVGGLTLEDAQGAIEKRLDEGGFVKSPHVSVFVNEYTSQGVSLLGEVTRPGVYPVIGDQRLFDVISAAGGLGEKSGPSVTITHRDKPDAPLTLPISRNIQDHPESNVQILPGDTISVRKADIVYVVGEVGRPSGFVMESGHLTILQALALAGGTTSTAKLGAARIIRKGPSGMTETPVALKKILQAKAPDLLMQGDDILFVPSSFAKIFARRGAEAAVSLAGSATLIAIH